MHRSRGLVVTLLVAACGPAATDREPVRPAPAAEHEPSSSEWLYVTRRVHSSRPEECRMVLEALRQEATCRRGLCQPAVRLAEDWTAVCAKGSAASAAEVRELEGALRARIRPAVHACEKEFEELMSSSCIPSRGEDCLERAQRWATACGKDYGTPLLLTMLSVRLERATGEPVTLDPRSCEDFLADLGGGLGCNNLPACQARLQTLAEYQARCPLEGGKAPLPRALVTLAVEAAAQRNAQPIPLGDLAFGPDAPVLPLADGQGAVLRVGWSHPTSPEAYREAVRTEEDAEIHFARVFRAADGAPELRLGTLAATDKRTPGERFRSLRVRGEEDEPQDAGARLQQQLARASQARAPSAAAAALLQGLDALGDLPAPPEPSRAALRASDAALEGVCRWVAQEKSRLLSKVGQRPVLVAATRRAERLPFADVSEAGGVELGAVAVGGIHDVRADMPRCASAYQEALAYLVGRVRTIQLPQADEEKLARDADAKTERCVAASKELADKEQKLLECVFGLRPCSEEEPDALTGEHDRTVVALRQARVEARLAAANVRDDLREARATRLARECLGGPISQPIPR
jgi:hypothetical protein